MANNPEKPPKPNVLGTASKQTRPGSRTVKDKSANRDEEAAKPPMPEVHPSSPDRSSVKAHSPAVSKRGALSLFEQRQREKLLALKDTLLDSMNGVAKDSLRSRAEGSEASAFGMHQADAGSDAYDRDFALSLLSQEQDSLYEIDEALKRIENGTYGICEMSGKSIPHARLEALPFTRYTVECQAELEKRNRFQRVRQPVISLFGLSDEEGAEEDEESGTDSKE
jgi:RNA polymerase-binding transcription factor DksA